MNIHTFPTSHNRVSFLVESGQRNEAWTAHTGKGESNIFSLSLARKSEIGGLIVNPSKRAKVIV